jgi:sugar O-acyltransferase (sialic acid O-acetyltransferase NeuD family)
LGAHAHLTANGPDARRWGSVADRPYARAKEAVNPADATIGHPQDDRRKRTVAKVVLFGNADMARMTYFYLTHDSEHDVVAFTVDGAHLRESSLFGLPVVPFEEVQLAYPPAEYQMGVPIAFTRVNRLRAAKYAEAKAKGYKLISYVCSKAATWPGLEVGDNTFIYESSAIGPFVTIGNDVIIAGSSIAHDCVIGDHAFIAAQAVVLGAVTVGAYSILGANSTCRHGITVGSACVIGAGAVVNKSIADRAVYVVKPAERLPKASDALGGWLNWPAGDPQAHPSDAPSKSRLPRP